MNLFTAIKISAYGLSAERTRLGVAAMNLANADVTKTVDGGPYRPKSVVFSAEPYNKTGQGGGGVSFADRFSQGLDALQVVKVAKIVEDKDPFREVYDPNNPDADQNGMVKLPNVNVMEQMVDIMTASRAYEANVTAINTAKSMALKTLEIGK
ncbi:MAG: flagellar basal body rod protein FlgC [Dissulfurimicrobium sp.]|uniref:flagellar basal body rod protein FlgC n=1 Tax=Dissulfurimicrobium TaxID=1769732 RepID=UPI001EDBAF68|nr:flagellar basal body rod protein FlgC [Dissulfurimicrobium hydrothermale]UKL13759.1 flagellar basal body rod protein FlgC [Dissulfurimicrobium hydrothermale]